MKKKVFAAVTAGLMLLNVVGFSFAAVPVRGAVVRQTNPLVSLLPASDAVFSIDSRRFFNQALPKLLSANQPLLEKLTTSLDEMQQKMGVDLRQFDQVAFGLVLKQGSKDFDSDPIIIARGSFTSGALLGLAKLGLNGKYREEKVGARTIYIFSVKDVVKDTAPKVNDPKATAAIDRTVNAWNEMALTAIDDNTLAFGTPALVRKTLAGTTHVDVSLTSLLEKNPSAVMSFAAKVAPGITKSIPHENDELGKAIDSIRFISGWVDVNDSGAGMHIAARTLLADQAQSILETLQGLQVIGKAFIGGIKGPEKAVIANMIDNVKFARTGSEISIDLSIPQSDIDILIGQIKLDGDKQ